MKNSSAILWKLFRNDLLLLFLLLIWAAACNAQAATGRDAILQKRAAGYRDSVEKYIELTNYYTLTRSLMAFETHEKISAYQDSLAVIQNAAIIEKEKRRLESKYKIKLNK